MKKYQIVEVTEQLNHAGTKATADIAEIAEKLGFRRLNVKMDTSEKSTKGKVLRQVGYIRDWKKVKNEITSGSVLLLQHPFHYKQLTRNKVLHEIKRRDIKVISLVHDVEEIRAFRFSEYYKHEFEVMLELADVIIVHNEVMKQWFIEKGVEENKLISLEIFDYLQNGNKEKNITFEKSITIAGNLDTTKCGYIGELGKIKGITIHLYGPNFNEELCRGDNIEYHGSFPVNDIPNKLDRGFGLVWDGESVDGCKGLSGQYLCYNNPHKLSLYLSSGLPVVIWRGAAEATFVEKNGLGIIVDGLSELQSVISNVSIDRWNEYLRNVNRIKLQLRDGFYAKSAIEKAINIVEKRQNA